MSRIHRFKGRGVAAANANIGINIPAGKDFDGTHIFVDSTINGRGFQTAGAFDNTCVALDGAGWPTVDFRFVICAMAVNQSWMVGTWKISFTSKNGGAETLSTVGATGVSFASVVHGASTTFDMVVTSAALSVFLEVTGTTGGITNLKIIKPGYPSSGYQTFTNEIIAQLAPFGTLRFGPDFTATNGGVETTWSARPTPTTLRTDQSELASHPFRGYGRPWEFCVEMCNTMVKNGWFCLHLNVTDDYVTQFATLLRDTMSSALLKHIEFSNELWNTTFSQEGANRTLAIAEAAATPSILNYDGSNDQYNFARRRIVKRCREISIIFQTVFGATRYAAEVRVHGGAQATNQFNLRDQLRFINTVYGAPSQWLYSMTMGAYCNQDMSPIGGADERFSTGLSTAQVLTGLTTTANNFNCINHNEISSEACQQYGVRITCYEFGIDTNFSGSTASKTAAQIHADMQGIQSTIIKTLYNAGFDLVVGYKAGVEPGGTVFGVFNSSTGVLTAPKQLSYINYATNGKGTPTRNLAPGTWDGRVFCADKFATSGTYPNLGDSTKSNQYIAVVWVLTTGTYALTITYASTTAGTVNLEVNQAVVQTGLSVTNSGGANAAMAPQNITLVAGQPNFIRWGNRSAGQGTISVKQVQIA